MSHKLDYEKRPAEKPLRIQIWNVLGIAAAVVVACDFMLEFFLVAMPRPFHRAVTIAAILLVVWLLNKDFFQPMREAMQQANSDDKKDST